MTRSLSELEVLVLLKIIALGGKTWTQQSIAFELSLSQSVVNRALKKSESLSLFDSKTRRVNGRYLEDALIHGARFFLASERGGEVRGVPTAWAAKPLSDEIVTSAVFPPVWPDPFGSVRGWSVSPLHPKVPEAVKSDRNLYELLALLDVFRIGGAREIGLAERAFRKRIELYGRTITH